MCVRVCYCNPPVDLLCMQVLTAQAADCEWLQLNRTDAESRWAPALVDCEDLIVQFLKLRSVSFTDFAQRNSTNAGNYKIHQRPANWCR